MTRAERIAAKMAAVREVLRRSESAGEREAAAAALARLTANLEAVLGVSDEQAVLDPVGQTCVDVGPPRHWRRECATAAGLLGGVHTHYVVGEPIVVFTGRRSGRMLAEHLVHHFVSSIDRAAERFVKDRRRRRRPLKTSRKQIEAFRRQAAETLVDRACDAIDDATLAEYESHRPDNTESVWPSTPVDRRLAGVREGREAAGRIGLDRPLTGAGPAALPRRC